MRLRMTKWLKPCQAWLEWYFWSLSLAPRQRRLWMILPMTYEIWSRPCYDSLRVVFPSNLPWLVTMKRSNLAKRCYGSLQSLKACMAYTFRTRCLRSKHWTGLMEFSCVIKALSSIFHHSYLTSLFCEEKLKFANALLESSSVHVSCW